jgi:hypothetical protein
MNLNAKILSKILVKWIEKHIKRITHHDEVSLILGMKGCFNIYKSVNIVLHINTIKENKHIIF